MNKPDREGQDYFSRYKVGFQTPLKGVQKGEEVASLRGRDLYIRNDIRVSAFFVAGIYSSSGVAVVRAVDH